MLIGEVFSYLGFLSFSEILKELEEFKKNK